MNPLALLKQEILEQLRSAQGPVSLDQVIAMFHRDARSNEIAEVLNDLLRTKQVKRHKLPSGVTVLQAAMSPKDTEDEMLRLLSED